MNTIFSVTENNTTKQVLAIGTGNTAVNNLMKQYKLFYTNAVFCLHKKVKLIGFTKDSTITENVIAPDLRLFNELTSSEKNRFSAVLKSIANKKAARATIKLVPYIE